ncbi:MAG TPA: cytochrome P450 [Caulobacteraceae bacterium]|jgi:cytochrome P450|nr:cytochrome P450 [Caulobacteraceae bacterium]
MPNAGPDRSQSPLVGSLAAVARRRGRSRSGAEADGLIAALPAAAYENLIFEGASLFGRYLVVSDPAGIRRVLVENAANYPKTQMDVRFFAALFGGGLLGIEGEEWRRHRRIMAPSFDPRSVAAYAPALAATVGSFIDRWGARPDGAPVDMAAEMIALTMEVISRTVFSTESAEMAALVRHTVDVAFAQAGTANLLDLVPVLKDLRMRARARRVAAASAPLDAAIERLLAAREAAPGPADLITRLLAARDLEDGGRLTAKEIRDEIVTIYVAGHETTASTLTWAFYLLAQRPAVAERLHGELDEVLGGRSPAPEDLARLVFTRRVVDESLRLYPAAPGISTRQALADDEICGVRVKAGTQVNILPWVVHRHRKLWDDPEMFDPDRFSPERSAGRPRFAYVPFGAGPRVCIGQVLALNESVLALAGLAQRWTPELAPDARVVLHANVTLRPKFGLSMRLARRVAGGSAPAAEDEGRAAAQPKEEAHVVGH